MRAGAWAAGMVLAAWAGIAAAPASAEWLRAQTPHFVVIENAPEAAVREDATQLEQFDNALRHLFPPPESDVPASANRVTVYVAPSVAAVQRLYGSGGDHIYGFYTPRADGSVAFTPRRAPDQQGDNALKPRIVLFHEYTHHFLLGSYAAAYPGWFSEGFAEFASTARFDKTGVMIGVAAQHRAYDLLEGPGMSVERLFALDGRKLSDTDEYALYARGWLLTHYLIFNPTMRAKFGAYLTALNRGTPSMVAARAAFGDLKQLDRDLAAYLRRSKIPGILIPYDKLPAVTVDLRPLSDGERALIGLRMTSTRGVSDTTAKPLFAQAAPIAAHYPGDAVAQGWLAEMAYDAGDDAASEAAADRALAADPRQIQALLYKARVHLRRAMQAKATDPAVWKEARSWIVKANRVDPDSAPTLELFYQSFLMAHQRPSESASIGIRRAQQIVPQAPGLRFAAASDYMLHHQPQPAREVLRPLAYDPHAGADNAAAKMIAAIDAGTPVAADPQASSPAP